MVLRYLVERISDGEFLELDLPISVSGAGRKRSGFGRFSGEIAPIFDVYKYAGSDALIDPNGTFIHEEADGVIRGTWIVTRCEFQGAIWRVEGIGFSGYFAGRPYEGEYRGVQVDPVDAGRHVIEHSQSFPGADIGVTVRGASTMRVGTDSDERVAALEAELKEAKRLKKLHTDARAAETKQKQAVTKTHDAKIKALQATSKARLETLQELRRVGASPAEVAAAQNARNAAMQAVKDAQAAKKAALAPIDAHLATIRDAIKVTDGMIDTAQKKLEPAKEQQQADGGAWKILWWDTPDCLQSMQEAFDACGYEWVEWSGWDSTGTKVLKEIRAVPRVGRKQDGLSFVEGDNIIEAVQVEADAADYANTGLAIGAGEGKKALRVTMSVPSSRRRTVYVLDAKEVTKRSVLETMARAELAARSQLLSVAAVRVVNHPNAEFGAFGVGDSILIDTDGSGAGRQRIWRRIEELEWVGADVCDLMLGGV